MQNALDFSVLSVFCCLARHSAALSAGVSPLRRALAHGNHCSVRARGWTESEWARARIASFLTIDNYNNYIRSRIYFSATYPEPNGAVSVYPRARTFRRVSARRETVTNSTNSNGTRAPQAHNQLTQLNAKWPGKLIKLIPIVKVY